MKIGMITDAPMHNLALMKLSTYHKSLGDSVELINKDKIRSFDKVYGSYIFTWNRNKALELKQVYGDKAIISGTGVDVTDKLPKHVEMLKPDYSLFDLDYGVGFTRRGCINKCSFCVVPKKEIWKEDTAIKDIINPLSNRVYILDNNFSNDPNFELKVKEFNNRNLIVSLQSGVDVRTMTCEKARLLSTINHEKQLHIAWDNYNHKKSVLKGIDYLLNYFKPSKLMCYVLIGFNSTREEDFLRIDELRRLKIDPYVMMYRDPYDPNYKFDRMDMHFKNWVNGHAYKSVPFEEFDRAINEIKKRQQLSLF